MAQVSIIIPVYNVDKYLERCLASVVSQTFADIEIIAVNDGSTDRSRIIIGEYAAKDSRIRIIDKENEGLAMARATGVENASSPYIYHLDGDDYIEPELIEVVYNEMIKLNADIVMFRFQIEYDTKTEISHPYPKAEYDRIALLKHLWRGSGYYAVWAYMHRKSLYDNVSFYKGLSFAEDVYLTSQLIYNAGKIYFLDSKPLLHYIIRNTSISNGKIGGGKIKDILLYPELVRKFMADKPEYTDLEEDLVCLKLIAYNTLLQRECFEGAKTRSKESVEMIRKYPNLAKVPSVKAFRKLFSVFAVNQLAGVVYAKYYKFKGKIY